MTRVERSATRVVYNQRLKSYYCETPMRLSDFIRDSGDEIVSHSVRFAESLGPLSNSGIDVSVLRDHLPLVLDAIAIDLDRSQTLAEGITKSEGGSAAPLGETAAQTHGRLRAQSGLSVGQVVAEYRVLRAVITRLWSDAERGLPQSSVSELVRFSEAIDQAIAESVSFHSAEVERWRDTLLAVIGHDLRGPLSALMVTTEMLTVRTAETPSARFVGVLKHGIDRLNELLDSLLDYSRVRLGSGMVIRRQPADLAEACREELELLRASLPDVALDFEIHGSFAGDFDASRIREALSNLVSNAAQYKRPGTPIKAALQGDSSTVTLAVVNEGDAIAPDVLQTFFEPLRRRDLSASAGPRKNLGIGLFVVREIARAHGGTVEADARGGLVRFEMRLPKAVPAK